MTRSITVTMSRDEAEAISFALSDVLCWCAGFEAGRAGTGEPAGPMNIERLRDMNIHIKNSLDRADIEKETTE